MKRPLLAVSLALVALLVLSGTALAGEWSPGKNRDTAAKTHGHSACLFNGRDQPDESYPGAGNGEPVGYEDLDESGSWEPGEPFFGDDADWAAGPSKGKVQSYGQIVASGFKAFAPSPGIACNPTSGFEE